VPFTLLFDETSGPLGLGGFFLFALCGRWKGNTMQTPTTVTSFLYKTQAEDAARFHVSIFPGTKITELFAIPLAG
jgi:hypothetical protein